jgi:hypothetical protein
MPGAPTPFAPKQTIVAQTLGGIALGCVQAALLKSAAIGLVLVPLFALTALLIGLVIVGAQRVAHGRRRWAQAAIIAAPSLLLTVPVALASEAFKGAYAETLPLGHALPFLLPPLGWALLAGAVWLRMRAETRVSRAVIVASALLAVIAIVWVERHILGAQYPALHIGGVLGVIVLLGTMISLTVPLRPNTRLITAFCAAVICCGATAALLGLRDPDQRRLIADHDVHARDVVRLWRNLFDFDRDGSSSILGSGDCDDLNARLHPGAADMPGDGIDQDCDGSDSETRPESGRPTSKLVAEWRTANQPFFERTRAMNVLLVSVDALRLDMLDSAREEFPALGKLLASSIVVERAFAPAPVTAISLGAIVTGRTDPFQRLKSTLAEAVQRSGRMTISVLPDEISKYVSSVLLGRGFTRSIQVAGGATRADRTTAAAVQALPTASAQPWFAWVHYFDVHEHFKQPAAASTEQRYRAAVKRVDTAIGQLLDEVARRGEQDKTIVIFLSDHGESLLEEPRLDSTHGNVAYPIVIRVPFAIRVPGLPPGKRDDIVHLTDIAPTILSLAGIPDAFSLDGIDLTPALLDGDRSLRSPQQRTLFAQAKRQWAVIEWPYFLVCRLGDNLLELYNLESDRFGHHDISAQNPSVIRLLLGRYGASPPAPFLGTSEGRAWRERQARPQ